VPAALAVLKEKKFRWLISGVLGLLVIASLYASSKIEANLNRTWTSLTQANLRLQQ
jgi:hypothetical protein